MTRIRTRYRQQAPEEDSRISTREKYRLTKEYREIARKRSHVFYRKHNPKEESKIKRGLLLSGVEKVVYVFGKPNELYRIEVFSVLRAAKALGKNTLTIKKWIRKNKIPPPVLRCVSLGYKHYSLDELQTIANVLRAHEQEYEYLRDNHVEVMQEIHKAVEIVRGYGYGESYEAET